MQREHEMTNPSRGPVAFERRSATGPRTPLKSKPKAWSHQDELKAGRGKKITLTHVSGETVVGKLLEADQFTIKVLHVVGNGQSALTYFKHDLCGYVIEE